MENNLPKLKDLQQVLYCDYELVHYGTGEKLEKAPLTNKWRDNKVVCIKPKYRTTNYHSSIMVETYLEIHLLVEGD